MLREAWELRRDAYGADDTRTIEAATAMRGEAPRIDTRPRTAAR